MVEELIRIFKLQKIKNQLPFLQAFTDLILEYKQSKGKEITSFLDWWEKNGNKKLSLSSQNNAIQLITIHKSKGLEFNFVIMPFFNWTLDNDSRGGKEKLIWVNLNSFNKKFDFFYPLKYKSSHPKTLFESSYINERKKAYEDNLNLMYVSFTRPKLGLLINAEKMIREDIKNVSDVLYSSLKDNLKDNSFISGKIINVNNSHFKKVYHLNNYPSYSWKVSKLSLRSFIITCLSHTLTIKPSLDILPSPIVTSILSLLCSYSWTVSKSKSELSLLIFL